MGVVEPFVRALLEDEPSLAWFGFTVEEATEGRSTVSVVVTAEHINGNGMAHGGVIFSVADQAFAMAANTVLPFAATVDAQIHYLAPCRAGQRLVAFAHVEWSDERRSVVNVMVMADGVAVASYRGMARTSRRP